MQVLRCIFVALAAAIAAWTSAQTSPQEGELAERVTRNRSDLVALQELYRLYVNSRRLADAEKILKAAVEANPGQFNLMAALASHYAATGQREPLDDIIAQMLKHSEWNETYFTAGDLYLRIMAPDQALRFYREGLTKDPDRKAAYYKRVIEVRLLQGKTDEAEAVASQLMVEYPTDVDGRAFLAGRQLDRGEGAEAVTALQALAREAPHNPLIHFQLGRALAATGKGSGEEQFRHALQLRPDYWMARLALAQLMLAQAKNDEAIKEVKAILAVDAKNLQARLIETAALSGMKEFDKAKPLLDQLQIEFPNSAPVSLQLGFLYLRQNKFPEAEAAYRKARELAPKNSGGLMGIVETYMAQNRAADAQLLLESEIEKTPRADLRIAAGNVAVRVGKWDAGIAHFEKALAGLAPTSPAAVNLYLRIGETYRRKGDTDKSVQWLQKAREAQPDNLSALFTLALALDAAGRKAEAATAYEAALKLDPKNGIILNNLAFLLAETGGDLVNAQSYAQMAREFLPESTEVTDTLAWVYLKKGTAREAMPLLREIVGKVPANPTYRYHLAMALAAVGNKTEAVSELRAALKNRPLKQDEEKIRKLLAELSAK